MVYTAKDFAKLFDKKLRIEILDGTIVEGIAEDVIRGDDKSDDAFDYGIDSLILSLGNGLCEILGNDVKSIEIVYD